jgi:hypothetical protein
MALIVAFVPVLLVVVPLWLVFFLAASVCLHAMIWVCWCIRGRDVLFVYSNSPVWHGYIEHNILPRLGQRAVVLNWSKRKAWRFSLAWLAFHHFGGRQDYNPLAVVFRPFCQTRTFRFLQPFADFKRGRPEALHRMESEFFALIRVPRHAPSE